MRSRLTVTLAALLTVALAGCTQGGKPADSKNSGGTVELTMLTFETPNLPARSGFAASTPTPATATCPARG